MSEQKDREKRFVEELQHLLQSHNYKSIHSKIEDLKFSGKAGILPYLLDLLCGDCPESIKQDVLTLVGDLKLQACSEIIAEYIKKRKAGAYLSQLIASCWQSSLDFSGNLAIFTDCFVTENYQTALESFTLIEEMLWRTKADLILSCKQMLIERISEISTEKLTLYHELIKLLDEQKTASQEDFPDLYLN
jgi:hypothetical protein